jgi:hypothetical protein
VAFVIAVACIPWNTYAVSNPGNEIQWPLCSLEFTCPISDGGIFNCVDDIPDQDFTAIHVLDSCGNVSITVSESITGSGCVNDTMLVRRVYRITDGISTDSCVQLFHVVDVTPPTVSELPGDLILSCSATVPPPNEGLIQGLDGCSNSLLINYASDSIFNVTCSNSYQIMRLYIASGWMW